MVRSTHSQSTNTQDVNLPQPAIIGAIDGRLPAVSSPETIRGNAHKDVYALVTEKIEAALREGIVPWKKPWAVEGGLPRNLVTGKPYRGMNVLLLSLGQPYRSPWWLTFRQAEEMKGHVRRGEKSSLVTFWKSADRAVSEPDAESEDVTEDRRDRRTRILRYYNVFNLEQCEGIETPPNNEVQPREHERVAVCESIVSGMPQPPSIRRDPRYAVYSPSSDSVGIPDIEQFTTAEDYYATLFHELIHSTGHHSRLARPTLGTPTPFGTPDYSKEELVAEFGAAFLCGHSGILPTTVENQASYIDGWLSVLKQDKRLLPIAAAQAQRAADYVLGWPDTHMLPLAEAMHTSITSL